MLSILIIIASIFCLCSPTAIASISIGHENFHIFHLIEVIDQSSAIDVHHHHEQHAPDHKASSFVFNPAEDYSFVNCRSETSTSNQQLSTSFSLHMIHQPRSASRDSPRLLFCLDEDDDKADRVTSNSRCDDLSFRSDDDDDVIVVTCSIDNPESIIKNSGNDNSGIIKMKLRVPHRLHDSNTQKDSPFHHDDPTRSADQLSSSGSDEEFPPFSPSYNSYQRIVERMQQLEKNYPALVQTFVLSTSSDEKSTFATASSARTANSNLIYGAKLSTTLFRSKKKNSPSSSQSQSRLENDLNKREIVLLGGQHAREWIAIEVTVAILEALVNLLHINKKARQAISAFEWIIVPCVNPDGYEFSRSSSSNRFWRKNRRRLDERDTRFYGVDLNRNFPFQWGLDSGSSPTYYQETYRGPSAASEIETKAIISLLQNQNVISKSGFKLNAKHSLAALFSIHSYGGAYLIPPGYQTILYTETFSLTKSLLTDSIDQYHSKLTSLSSSSSSGSFSAIEAWNLYPVSGELTDYVHEEFAQVPSAVIELRPVNGFGNLGFVLDESEIPRSIMEQTMTMLHLANTVRRAVSNSFLSENTSGDPSTVATTTTSSSHHHHHRDRLWYRDNQSDFKSIINVTEILLQNRHDEDEDEDGVKDLFDACLLLSSNTTSSPQEATLARYLTRQNALRAKFFMIQRDHGCIAPWFSIMSSSTKVSEALFDNNNQKTQNAFWSQVFTDGNSLEQYSLRDASSSLKRMWKANAPSVIDFRGDQETSNEDSSSSWISVPISLLVRSSKASQSGFCSVAKTMSSSEVASSVRNQLKIGYENIFNCSSPPSSVTTRHGISQLLTNKEGIFPTSISSNIESRFKVLMVDDNNKNNDVVSFKLNPSSGVNTGNSDDLSLDEYCSVRVRFELVADLNNNNLPEQQENEEEVLNDLVSAVGEEVVKSMDSTVRNLSCNRNDDQQQQQSAVASGETGVIVGMQVRFAMFDESSLLAQTSGSSRLKSKNVAIMIVSILFFWF